MSLIDSISEINVSSVIIYICVAVLIYLICREINCWFWKINRRIQLMEENNQLLKKLIAIEESRIVKTNYKINNYEESDSLTNDNDEQLYDEVHEDMS